MCTSPQANDFVRVLLYRSGRKEVLLKKTSRGSALPIIVIPANTRVAEELTKAIRSSWNLETYCLFSTRAQTGDSHAVMESADAKAQPPHGMHRMGLDSLLGQPFADPSHRFLIQTTEETLDGYRRGTLPGFFAKPGWISVVKRWVAREAAALGLTLTGNPRQLNASPAFSLLRFETSGPAVWFKAVGEPNLREYPITRALARHFPAFVPCVIGVCPQSNGWLALEANGVHPGPESPSDVWRTVATTLAELQTASLAHSLHLLEAGCRDARISTLAEAVPSFFSGIEELMAQQTQATPPRLTPPELATLRAELEDLLAEYRDLQIPNVIGHFDINPGNIVVSGRRCVFLDWAEGHAGSPFLTFTYLAECIRRFGEANRGDASWKLAFIEPWRNFLSSEQIERAIELSPLLAVFAYANTRRSLDQKPEQGTEQARYLRSLARRMKAEADRLAHRSCV